MSTHRYLVAVTGLAGVLAGCASHAKPSIARADKQAEAVAISVVPGPPPPAPGPPVELPWRSTVDLPVESVGPTLGVNAYRQMPMVGDAKSGWTLPLWFRDESRQINFRTIDLGTGAVHDSYPGLPAYEVWTSQLIGDRLYLGANAPALLVTYDRKLDSFKNLGSPFDGCAGVYSMAAGPDGSIVVGGVGCSEVSIYEPRTDKISRLGNLGPKGYEHVYYLADHPDFIYAALRGSAPWLVRAVDRKTGAQRTVYEAPSNAYRVVGMYGDLLRVVDPDNQLHYYRLAGGAATELTKDLPRLAAVAGPPAPTIQIADEIPGVLQVYWQLPGASSWRSASLTIATQPTIVSKLLAWNGTTILGASSPYGPLFKYSTDSDSGQVLGMTPEGMGVYAMARQGNTGYVGGYPSADLLAVNVDAPFTLAKSCPGRPGTPASSARANPRHIEYVASKLKVSAQDVIGVFAGEDGQLWLVMYGFRYQSGFSLVAYDPASGTLKAWNDDGKFDHLQVSWVTGLSTPSPSSQRILISTRVKANPDLASPVPVAAKIFVFDTGSHRMKELTPFPDEPMIGPVAYSATAKKIIGLIPRAAESSTTIFAVDPGTGVVSRTSAYLGIIAGVPDTQGLPRKGPSFLPGPDGNVWTTFKLGSVTNYPSLLLKIDSATLEVQPVGRIGPTASFTPLLFVGKDIYIGGDKRMRRVRHVVP
jgi:hypothetical protein